MPARSGKVSHAPLRAPASAKPVFRTPAGKFDREAYQRWYMKRWRAAKKAEEGK
jgi:hypothetical protein